MYNGDNNHGVHGRAIVGRQRDKAEASEARQAVSHEVLVENERALAADEPYDADDQQLKADDAATKAYMDVHDHYRSAYNAVQRREFVTVYVSWMTDLLSAILGRKIELSAEDGPAISKMIWEAGQERRRLLDKIARVQETIAVSADSVASQQRLISRMTRDAMRGKAAHDAFMLLAVRLGINPVPENPEEYANAIMAVYQRADDERVREEAERDAAVAALRHLCEYAGGGREGSIEELATHIKGAISV